MLRHYSRLKEMKETNAMDDLGSDPKIGKIVTKDDIVIIGEILIQFVY